MRRSTPRAPPSACTREGNLMGGTLFRISRDTLSILTNIHNYADAVIIIGDDAFSARDLVGWGKQY